MMSEAMTKDQLAFDREMVPHMDTMYNYALYLTGRREAAQDLLQETFLKAFRFFQSFQPGTNSRAWLYRIMRNTFINEYRREKRIPDHVEYDDQISGPHMLVDETISQENLSQKISSELFEDEIASAIAALPEKYKSVVILRDIEDLQYEEIADAMGVPIGTVRSRLHRARAMLFDALKEYARNRGYAVGQSFVMQESLAAG
jgi:RNA polymerase sigma-70 factor (ECF subfamily)